MMHHVDRGPEPARLAAVRQRETPKWVAYYDKRRKAKPSGEPWRKFEPDLREVFHGLCGYCEEICKGEVDHFRPKRLFPKRVYRWTNWVYSCHTCNHAKLDKWPSGGFVDPCARVASQRPEEFFEFDTLTTEILPRRGLSGARHRRAASMIRELDLNGHPYLRKRRQHLWVLSKALRSVDAGEPSHQAFVKLLASRHERLSSITRAFLAEEGYSFEDEPDDS